jgi:hypothetical protein
MFLLLVCLVGCSKESSNKVSIEYQLDASINTADHFYVTYLNQHRDTVVEHQHTGWKYSFSTTKPFNAYLQARVYHIDHYTFTIKILRDGKVVQEDSASTAAPGAIEIISLIDDGN